MRPNLRHIGHGQRPAPIVARLAVLLVSGVTSTAWLQGNDVPRAGPATAAPAEITKLVSALGSDQYRVREQATERLAAAGGPAVEAHIDESGWRSMSPEMAALAHRVMVEALTNVRRHAPTSSIVRVSVTAGNDEMEMTVTNKVAQPASYAPARGGRGIGQLAAMVADGGGDLSAGPAGEEWRLRLVLPVPRRAER